MGPLKYIGVFLDDLWLYFYDKRSYKGTMLVIFETINHIEGVKWTLMNYHLKVPINNSTVPISDFSAFSNERHMEVDDVDDSFARGTFSFVVFTVAQTLIQCLLLRKVFLWLSNYKISVYIRRFFFVGASMVQILVEGNISFLTYLFFKQALIPFSFSFMDKAFLALSYCLYFFIMVSLCAFYFICHELYRKNFGYFIYCLYRCFPTLVYLTIRFFIRGFLRGAIHSLLHNHYQTEIILLSALEAVMIIVTIAIEKKSEIFLTKAMFCFNLLYHFVFILINCLLLAEEAYKFDL